MFCKLRKVHKVTRFGMQLPVRVTFWYYTIIRYSDTWTHIFHSGTPSGAKQGVPDTWLKYLARTLQNIIRLIQMLGHSQDGKAHPNNYQGFPWLAFCQFLSPKPCSRPSEVRGKGPEWCIYDLSKIIFIYEFILWCISGLKGKSYQYFGGSFNFFKTTNP